MKTLSVGLIAVSLWGACVWAEDVSDQLPTPPESKAWKLVWQDEFDGTDLDGSKWETPEGKRRDGFWSKKAISLDGRLQHALHWDGYGKQHKSEGKAVEVPGVMEGFHTFSLLWKADEYVFYVDGKETWRSDAGGVCQVPLYIKLSDEIGTWGGNIADAKLPDRFLVDYVRVYDLVPR